MSDISISQSLTDVIRDRVPNGSLDKIIDELIRLGVIERNAVIRYLVKKKFEELRKNPQNSIRSCILDCSIELDVTENFVTTTIYPRKRKCK
jgi:hypothetical protein